MQGTNATYNQTELTENSAQGTHATNSLTKQKKTVPKSVTKQTIKQNSQKTRHNALP